MSASAKTNPFITVNSKCPICEREVVNRYLKSKVCTPVEVEDDRFVRKYKWELVQYKRLRPEYYQVWHCPKCHFCEEKEAFRGEDNLDGKLEIIQERLLIESRRPDSVLSRLGEFVDTENEAVTWSSALAAHILSIYIQNLLSPNMRLNGKLARYYLRTAWLFRERKYPELTAGQREVPELSSLLAELQSNWQDGPFSEEACMENAVKYFKLDLENAGRMDNIKAEVGIMFLLISLYLRLNRKRDAMDYVRVIFQSCTKRRSSAQKAVEGASNRKDVKPEQIDHLKNMLLWLKNTIERSVLLSEKLTEIIFRDEYPAAREKALAIENPTPELILEQMRAAGFYEGTCRRVVEIFKKNLLHAKLEELDAAEKEAENKTEQDKKKGGIFSKIADLFHSDETTPEESK